MPARLTVPAAGEVTSGRWPSGPGLPLALGGEERLARLAGEGSERAFAALYERYHQPLYRYCRSLVRSDVDAQDALQSTFTAALGALRRGHRDAPLRPWLFRIAHNESISLLRRRRPEAELSEATQSTVPSAEHSAEGRARLASVVADLGDLPERQRGALLMRELSGLSHEQIAEAFGISIGAAKQTVFEARRSLMEFAEGRAMACEDIQRVISDGDGRARRARRVRAHLRDCSCCAAFAAAIPGREADLRALTPALPVAAASGILARVIGAGSGTGGSASVSAGASGVAASVTGKTATTVVSLKAVTAGVAVITATAAGAAGALHKLSMQRAHRSGSRVAGTAHGRGSHAAAPSAGPASAASGRVSGPAARLAAAPAATGASTVGSAGRSGIKPAASKGNGGAAGRHGASGASNPGKHLGTVKNTSAGKHLGTVKTHTGGKHLGTVKTHTGGKHLGTVKTHTGSGGSGGGTHGSGSSSHPQKPVASTTPSTGPSASNGNGHGSAHTAAGQSASSSGSQASQGAGSPTTDANSTPAASSDPPAHANGHPTSSETGPGKSN